MVTRLHQQKNIPEFQEIDVLLCFQRMLDEKWNDVLKQMLDASHPIGHSIAVIHSNHAASEIRLEGIKHLYIALVLHDGEFRQHLNSRGHFLVWIDTHEKTTFPVHETCDPLRVQLHWTLPNVKSLRVPVGNTGLPCGLSP